MTKLIVAFRSVANAPENWILKFFYLYDHLLWWYECIQYCSVRSLTALFVAMVFFTTEQRVFIVKTFFECDFSSSAKKLHTLLLLWLTHSFCN
jgi:hypothetical protein